MALCDDELSSRTKDGYVEKARAFLAEVEQRLMNRQGPSLTEVMGAVATDPAFDFSGMPQVVDSLAGGAGAEIVRTADVSEEALRAQTLLTLLDDKLLPKHRAGSSYMIARIFEKHPEYGKTAQRHLLDLAGIKSDPRRVFMEMVDEGLGSFTVSLLALMPARA